VKRCRSDGTEIAGSSDQSCHTAPAPFGFYFYTDPAVSISTAQCQPLRLSWDNNVVYPLQAVGFVPGGSAFTIPVPQNRASLSTTWPVSIREGAQYQLLMAHGGQVATGGSTNLTWVTGGGAGCLTANSPGAGVRVATVINSAGTSSTRSLTSMRSTTDSPSSTTRPGGDNVGSSNSGSSASASTGAIAGGVVGGIAVIALLVLLVFCCRRRRRQQAQSREDYAASPAVESINQPEMRQASTSMGPAAVMRRATRSLGQANPRPAARESFDILSGPADEPVTPPPRDSPLSIEDAIDPFISPFPAPPPRTSLDHVDGNAIPWGAARGHTRELSGGTLESMTNGTATSGSLGPPALVPLNTSGQSSTARTSRKLSGQFGETPPQTPTLRQSSHPRSPVFRSTSSSGLTRWSVDEDQVLGSAPGPFGSGERLSAMTEGQVSPSTTTFIQHSDGGPGGVV
jgi:hypothetical protein